ncbi:hypothetical protein JOF47_002556 [Paeniglutamicibacter kerguelensis]|uniref:Uncharacterized protein n=1 Tax=Paeniglutamicibacter kerguelensis TaxID=254788 RepID=A0ABS4XF05_9MICC|nr:hypothetical protein [Paeniglutamicibacter kerguelensis]
MTQRLTQGKARMACPETTETGPSYGYAIIAAL